MKTIEQIAAEYGLQPQAARFALKQSGARPCQHTFVGVPEYDGVAMSLILASAANKLQVDADALAKQYGGDSTHDTRRPTT